MLDFLFGEGQYGLRFLFAFIVVLGLIGLTAWLVRRFGANHLGAAAPRGRQPRLAVIDATAVDARRRLVLIRRDNVEHLLMIGGPTDIVIESTIVRAGAARDAAALRQSAAAPDALARSAPLEEEAGVWPEPASQAAPRRIAPPPQPVEEPPEMWPEEPEPQQQSPRQARSLDPLAGLAAELSRHQAPEPAAAPLRPARPREVAHEAPHEAVPMHEIAREPMREVPREPMREPMREPIREVAREPMREVPREPMREPMREPVREPVREPMREPLREVAREPVRAPLPQPAPEAPFPVSADQNLAEMAQRLEAALRRPGARAEARPEPRPELRAEARPEPRPRPMAGPVPQDDAAPAEPPSEPAREPKPAPQRSLYDSLEQEMASLLGRPNSKA